VGSLKLISCMVWVTHQRVGVTHQFGSPFGADGETSLLDATFQFLVNRVNDEGHEDVHDGKEQRRA